MSPDFEHSGQYVVTRPSMTDLPKQLRHEIQEQAIHAYEEGKTVEDNPYSPGCAAYLQWKHSFLWWEEPR